MNSIILRIIAENPIGNGLDCFQEEFRSTCDKLGIPVSVEAVQQVLENGENIELAAKLSLTVCRLQRPACFSDRRVISPTSELVDSVRR
jgi:hypothetical protein